MRTILMLSLLLLAMESWSQQPWVQMYPGFNSNDVLDFQRWHGDTVFACGTNGNFILTTDAGRTWNNVLMNPLDWDFVRIESNENDLYLLPSPPIGSPHIETVFDSTRYLLFRYNVYSQAIERIAIPTPTKARVLDLSVTPDCITLYQFIKDSSILVQSTDEGKTWTYKLIPKNMHMAVSRYPTIHFRDKDKGILISFPTVTTGFAYLTLDGGLTWDQIENVAYPLGFYLNSSPKHPGHWLNDSIAILVSEGNIPCMTTNGGKTWLKKNQLESGIGYIEMTSENHGIAVGRNFEVYRTEDAWNTSVRVRSELHVDLNMPHACAIDSLRWIVGGYNGLKFCTSDGGLTWIDEYLSDVYITQLHFFNQNDGACTLTDIYTGGRWYCRTNDAGRTWARRYLLQDFYSIYHATSDIAYGVGGQSKTTSVYKTEDAGYSWVLKYQSSLLDSVVAIRPYTRSGDPDFFVCNTYNKRYLRTTDGGNSWSLLSGPSFSVADWSHKGSCWVLSHVDNLKNEVYKTTDDGETWQRIDIPDTVSAKKFYESIHVLSQDDVIIEPQYILYPIYSLYKTSDGGLSWSKLEPKFIKDILTIFKNGVIYGVGSDSNTKGVGNSWYGIMPSMMSRSDDYGESGKQIFRYSYAMSGRTSDVFILDENTIWIAIYNTIFHTTNGGISWTELPLPGAKSVSLQPNYPNPVTGSGGTTIPFTVTGNREVHVRIEVHDLLGRKVAAVHDKPVSPGSHSALWVTRGVSPGMYFVRIVGAESEVRKVVVR